MIEEIAEFAHAYLRQHNYSEPRKELESDRMRGILISTPRRAGTRYCCAIFEIPDSVGTASEGREIFRRIREAVSRGTGDKQLWKGIGTYAVWLCGHELYQALKGHLSKLKDRTGLHSNVMLGTILIDREQFVSSSESTWGLVYSGSHFKIISEVVNAWCKKRRGETS